jgi:ParB-like chromosome segregation protein Spo0J
VSSVLGPAATPHGYVDGKLLHRVKLNAIVVDKDLQPRANISRAHIESLCESAEFWPPIIVARVPTVGLVLIDGRHRLEAARDLQFGEVLAEIVPTPPDGDLHRLAFESNAAHGRPLSVEDRKRYAQRLLERHSELPDREIGRQAGLSHSTIGKLRAGQNGQVYIQAPKRKPGALPTFIGLLDRVRFAKATREQKAVVGYLKRLATALGDPYEDDHPLPLWEEGSDAVAQAIVAVLPRERAAELLSAINADVSFLLDVTRAANDLLLEKGAT